ncbi:hypothetical protein LTR62_006161 [Meristemomyces frigidus]|uniref:Thioredoxin domain-containing protein n=1 Tax=Meristemomyces frigidus TaxID=1508187 RepID=A0AAN7TEV9_9PEZI|nr:hypothetical protein LTR62_006161 [Meristemomyces frigidus]
MATRGNIHIGQRAPEFNCTAVVDGRFKEVTLSSYGEANHWVVLVFFPKAWSFICPTEIKAFSARLEEFIYSRSCAVLFCPTDSEHCLRAWNATSDVEGGLGGVHLPLMSDGNHKVSKDYGVLIEETGVAQRAMFIIDPKGLVRCITINDADVGRSVDEAQRVLDALVVKDEFGEGCPVDWKKGDKGINTATNVEGKHELKQSWSEWARPRLNRAFSGTSQRSLASAVSTTSHPADFQQQRKLVPPGMDLPPRSTSGSPYFMGGSPAAGHSPLVSPTSAPGVGSLQMEEALMMQQRLENMRAAMQNRDVGVVNWGS